MAQGCNTSWPLSIGGLFEHPGDLRIFRTTPMYSKVSSAIPYNAQVTKWCQELNLGQVYNSICPNHYKISWPSRLTFKLGPA